MNLVIVESPTKAKTLSKFLGSDFVIEASMGHVRDLPKKELGIDVDKDFQPSYIVSPKAKKTVANLKKKAKDAKRIILATDPDREGEAIAWHVLSILSDTKAKNPERVVFHEITEQAVKEAFDHGRSIDLHLVDAQQARRVLDRIVGYKLSPLLWKKVRYGLSAGRVQSVAVKLIVERELQRKAFKPEEYWSLEAEFLTEHKNILRASLSEIDGKKAEISSKEQMDAVLSELQKEERFRAFSVEKQERKRNPYPPFTTSTLQQAASNRLGFTARRTMSAAQKLFEAGLITYHRTDSLNLAGYFLNQAREFIAKEYGENFLPDKPNFYKSRVRNVQEAHEAVRPTNASRLKIDEEFSSDEKKLYQLIWRRAVSSQMLPQIYDQTTVLIDSEDRKHRFKAVGSVVKFEGWMKVYSHESEEENDEEKKELPIISQGDNLKRGELFPEQHFTEPPPRFTEASIIKALEEHGIGRPSTYAPTISTIQERGYVTKEGKYFIPQDVAVVVTRLMEEHFPEIVDVGFTASMEEDLDKVAEGQEKWVEVIRKFYEPFSKEVADKDNSLSKKDFTLLEETDEKCPECQKNLVIKLGKYGRFLSCSGFPDCKYARPIPNPNSSDVDTTQLGPCELCDNGVLTLKEGRFGKFLACSNYPKCKFTKPYMDKIGLKCPSCQDGDVVIKKGGRFKKNFYGCSRYPDCKFTSNKDPRNNQIEKSDNTRELPDQK